MMLYIGLVLIRVFALTLPRPPSSLMSLHGGKFSHTRLGSSSLVFVIIPDSSEGLPGVRRELRKLLLLPCFGPCMRVSPASSLHLFLARPVVFRSSLSRVRPLGPVHLASWSRLLCYSAPPWVVVLARLPS